MTTPLGHEEKARGSVYLTQKPLLNTQSPDSADKETLPSILIRASDGNTNAPSPKTHSNNKDKKAKDTKVKISTIVRPGELEAFYARYAEVCKAGMTGLKKRDRKLKKAKAKGSAGKVVKA
ncbi:hypothetical protein AN4580.2 [Aspergillus nidulans FGSC A4]|uniref:Signal recognition particle subunit SRP14 n=1 Tax=Emericella nidulans (strain FGSC A4 / ATCC 38163 / CBS 112.46 / NRRL 194 / M139) TaxID=227321 RepID=Q5B4F0_EMENI|nr:hypothetical protein [Aspergillus nidulans FGSC A4]EAA60923.1 hypothetical protein AN4580.2 [Aspergillus nidulans FGSC A4]CBF77215.1 TPA: signal recognition particle 14kD protein, putative (AFU_orthologue; AFUA_2G01990) [Aspergillus nidulans FGSC A4]|eukprot:XP_662184.1 hypothetical protein AN4580.2 [Aspergillus nidulans FGSC A4]